MHGSALSKYIDCRSRPKDMFPLASFCVDVSANGVFWQQTIRRLTVSDLSVWHQTRTWATQPQINLFKTHFNIILPSSSSSRTFRLSKTCPHQNYKCLSFIHSNYKSSHSFIHSIKVKVKLSLCLTKHRAMKTYWESGNIGPRIIDLGTRWRWVVSFTPRLLYPQGKSPLYPLDRRPGRTRSRSGHSGGEKKNSQPSFSYSNKTWIIV
jgi:hypothetical protein